MVLNSAMQNLIQKLRKISIISEKLGYLSEKLVYLPDRDFAEILHFSTVKNVDQRVFRSFYILLRSWIMSKS